MRLKNPQIQLGNNDSGQLQLRRGQNSANFREYHLSEEAAAFFAKNSIRADVWALPGKHQGEYEQIVVVAIKTAHQPNPTVLYQHLMTQKADPLPLVVQSGPVYHLPKPHMLKRFVFAPDMLDEDQGLRLLQEQGAWQTQGFQALLDVPPPPADIVPPVAPRPGHTALVLAAGIADGAVIESAEYGRVALRGKTRPIEVIARQEIQPDDRDPTHEVKKTTIRLKPTTTLTLLSQDGTLVEMAGDEPLLDFIRGHRQTLAAYLNRRFKPLYQFDMNGLGRTLERIRLNGKHSLYLAQRHVIGAITRAFQERDKLLLIGQMGVGKTALGSASAIAIATGAVKALQHDVRRDQVMLVVCPPHLIEKWKRELASIHAGAMVERLDRHEDVKVFMERAAKTDAGVPKIGLVKRDMTKLGAAREPTVRWRSIGRALWRHGEATPPGYLPAQRIVRERVPLCPNCGNIVMQSTKSGSTPANDAWLRSGKRECEICHTPLWQDARDSGSRLKAGEKYPTKNPRMRLDEYIKRQYKDRVYLLIWDEAHEAAHGDTGNGESFGRLAGCAHKVLAMTGTPFNGRSSSLFNLEYHLNPRVRQQYNWGGAPRFARKTRGSRTFPEILNDSSKQRGRAESRWVDAMGVREQVIEERPTYDSETGAYTGTTTYERPFEESPGISPLLIAEVLDHALFFSLGDLGKALPEYQEIALPVEPDADIAEQYDRTLQQLKDYLIARRWEGDTTFRGSYLQWAMGWLDTAHQPYEIIHNLRDVMTGLKRPHTVQHLESFGCERIYAKEQALIDLIREELANERPCVVYVRQTQTRDLQPRIMDLIQQHVPEAKPYILKNTVAAERREAVINGQVKAGINVLIANPELTKTGLDLLFAPTIVFYEPTFNLSTMMQAAARSYRLNQTHALCKVYYMFYESTMEHHAVQLMSRKQRAAKLLNGEIGLTGLDALTENEGGLEEALLQAIGQEASLLDPAQLFKTDSVSSAIDAEDAGYWNVAAPAVESDHVSVLPMLSSGAAEPVAIPAASLMVIMGGKSSPHERLKTAVERYLVQNSILPADRRAKMQVRVIAVLEHGLPNPADATLRLVNGIRHLDFNHDPAHADVITHWLTKYLRAEKAVLPEQCESAATELVKLVRQAVAESVPLPKTDLLPRRVTPRRKPDLSAVPDDAPVVSVARPPSRPSRPPVIVGLPQQMALFAYE